MPYLKEYHILISHSWDYSNHYQTVCAWLNSTNYFRWSNYSVPLTNPLDVNSKRELKEKLRNRIFSSSCIIVLSGMYVDYSDWIDFEMETAKGYRKPIIGVRPWGQERTPLKVQEYADIMVGWNSASVVQAVRDYAI